MFLFLYVWHVWPDLLPFHRYSYSGLIEISSEWLCTMAAPIYGQTPTFWRTESCRIADILWRILRCCSSVSLGILFMKISCGRAIHLWPFTLTDGSWPTCHGTCPRVFAMPGRKYSHFACGGPTPTWGEWVRVSELLYSRVVSVKLSHIHGYTEPFFEVNPRVRGCSVRSEYFSVDDTSCTLQTGWPNTAKCLEVETPFGLNRAWEQLNCE